jgi:protein-disulfide isomerase
MTKIFPLVVFLLGGCAPSAFPQSEDEVKGLRRDLDAVRDSLKVIQSDLETIKKLLQQRPAAAPQAKPFQEATISIDGAPSLGDKNAKVTLIEFSDYQCPFCKEF